MMWYLLQNDCAIRKWESWKYNHHVSGRLGAIEDPNGEVNYFEYDQQGRVTKQNTYAQDPTHLQWNEQGLLIAETYQG